jgi:predicted DNA-binding transcriptional regulator YafY
MFTAEEAMALAVGEDLVKQFTDRSLATPMSSALLKIRSVLPAPCQDDLDRLANSTAVEGRPRLPEDLDRRTLLPLQQAVVGRRTIRLAYRDRADSETAREVEPLGVVRYADAWYLVAWCRLRKDYRHFRLDRIRRLEVLAERFAPRPDFSLRRHLEEGMAQAEWIEVRVRFDRDVRDRVRRECFTSPTGERLVPGGVEWTLRTHSLDWFARWLLSFGTAATALAPAELRDKIATLAQEVAARHAKRRQPS